MKSLFKAIDTIDAVAEAGSVGIRELSAITGFPPSTIHRIVTTLVEKNYRPVKMRQGVRLSLSSK